MGQFVIFYKLIHLNIWYWCMWVSACMHANACLYGGACGGHRAQLYGVCFLFPHLLGFGDCTVVSISLGCVARAFPYWITLIRLKKNQTKLQLPSCISLSPLFREREEFPFMLQIYDQEMLYTCVNRQRIKTKSNIHAAAIFINKISSFFWVPSHAWIN